MSGIIGIYAVQKDGTVLLKREYRTQELILTVEQVRLLKDHALSSDHFAVFKMPFQVNENPNSYSVCYIKRNDLLFLALSRDDLSMGCDSLNIYQVLKLLIEVVDESVGLDKISDNFSSLSLVLDTMIDHGFPLITSKPILVTMLEKADFMNKASDMLTGQISNKLSQTLSNALTQVNNNQNSLWRFNQNSSMESVITNSAKPKVEPVAFIKDVFVDLIEYADCIFNENGELEAQEVSGEVLVEAKIPGNTPQMSVKIKFNQDIDDYVVHQQCQQKSLETIGNHEYSITTFSPPYGKFVLLKYITKPFPVQLPFFLKANYQVNRGLCPFDCKLERYQIGKEKDGSPSYPALGSIFVKFYFPEEISGAELTSHPEGIFSYDDTQKIGEWVINVPKNSQQKISLQGSLRVADTQLTEFSSQIVAIVNLKINDYSYSGSAVEKVICNLQGGSKDDATVFKGIKVKSYAKNIEFRL